MAKTEIERVGHGVFGWDGTERRSDRYGAFVLTQRPYNGGSVAAAYVDLAVLRALDGKRVHIRATVVATRESGHAGDQFLGLAPSTPEVGEEVDLGVGILRHIEPGWETQIVLEPGDDREHFWIDPRKLYRLHDQTVDLFIVETSEDFSPAPDVKPVSVAEAIDNGDGSFQVKGVKNDVPFTIESDIERLGDGLFTISPPTGLERGKRRKIR